MQRHVIARGVATWSAQHSNVSDVGQMLGKSWSTLLNRFNNVGQHLPIDLLQLLL